METLLAGLYQIVYEEQPTTVRHVFYKAVAAGLIPKTEEAYKGIVVRLLTQMRRSGSLPYKWISDNTRWVLRTQTYRSSQEAVAELARTYRRNLWDGMNVRVEIWCEKDAVAGILSDEADGWCVPTMVFRGYSSVSYLYTIAEQIKRHGHPTYIYYFGDRDPSGVDIERFVTERIREMAPEAEIHVERIAVTPEQIKEYDLPTRPTKKTDSRAKSFKGRSVEVDALDSETLKKFVREVIWRHLDRDEVLRLVAIEKAERDTLKTFAAGWKRKTP